MNHRLDQVQRLLLHVSLSIRIQPSGLDASIDRTDDGSEARSEDESSRTAQTDFRWLFSKEWGIDNQIILVNSPCDVEQNSSTCDKRLLFFNRTKFQLTIPN